MSVKILYFASLREKLGCASEELALPEGVSTLGALRAHLATRGGAWAEALSEGRLVRMAVNQEMSPPGTAVADGQEVAFFPPVTGG